MAPRSGKTIYETERRLEETPTEEIIERARGDPFGEPLSPEEQFQLLDDVGETRAEALATEFDGFGELQSASTERIDVEGVSQQKGAILSREILKRGIDDIDERPDVRGGKRRQAQKFRNTATKEVQLNDEETVTPAERIQVGTRHQQRSGKAQRTDERKQAPVTGDADRWLAAPGQYDFPGVDSTRDVEEEFPDWDKRVSRGTLFSSLVEKTERQKQERDDDVLFFAAEEYNIPL